MKIRIGARKVGGIWHGYIEGRQLPDDDSLRALTHEIALGKAERTARKVAEREGLANVQIERIDG